MKNITNPGQVNVEHCKDLEILPNYSPILGKWKKEFIKKYTDNPWCWMISKFKFEDQNEFLKSEITYLLNTPTETRKSKNSLSRTLRVQLCLIYFIWSSFNLMTSWWSYNVGSSNYDTYVKMPEQGELTVKALFFLGGGGRESAGIRI